MNKNYQKNPYYYNYIDNYVTKEVKDILMNKENNEGILKVYNEFNFSNVSKDPYSEKKSFFESPNTKEKIEKYFENNIEIFCNDQEKNNKIIELENEINFYEKKLKELEFNYESSESNLKNDFLTNYYQRISDLKRDTEIFIRNNLNCAFSIKNTNYTHDSK